MAQRHARQWLSNACNVQWLHHPHHLTLAVPDALGSQVSLTH